MLCPQCSSHEVRRSKYQRSDLARVVLLMSPYRCRTCGKRFFKFWWSGLHLRPRQVLRALEDSVKEVYRTQRERAALLNQPPPENRRAWVRHLCDVQTSCQPNSGAEMNWPVRIRDVSCGGIKLVAHQPFATGTILNIQLGTGNDGVTRMALAEVLHANEQHDGTWALGCRFTKELTEQDMDAIRNRS
jgi:PilZ domain